MHLRLWLLAALLLPSTVLAASEKVVVLPLKAKLGVQAGVAEVVSDAFVAALQGRGVQVITQKDVDNMLGLAQKRAELNVKVAQRLGEDTCSADAECLTEIGGALGATYLVTGTLSKLGSTLQLTAELLDQRKANVVRRFHEGSRSSGDDAYLALAKKAAAALFPLPEDEATIVKSEVSFGTGVQVSVPSVRVLPGEGLQGLNVRAEKLLEEALDAQDSRASARTVRDAWCALANVEGENPYAKKAREACEGWTQFVATNDALEKAAGELKSYIALKRKTREQKLAVVNAFLDTYGAVPSTPVHWAFQLRDRFEAGEEPDGSDFESKEYRSGLTFVKLPGRSYELGCVKGDAACDDDEKPAREVTLSPFSLSTTEVTVRAYAKCADSGTCPKTPRQSDTPTKSCNWNNDRLDHPMNCVTWSEANAFCGWVSGRLPTAAEWEYAARAGRDAVHPWGNSPVEATRANFCDRNCTQALEAAKRKLVEQRGWADKKQDDGWAGTSPAAAFPRGVNPWGLYDMAGNVWEWTGSEYDSSTKELRGGSWSSRAASLRASVRLRAQPELRDPNVGFRCAK